MKLAVLLNRFSPRWSIQGKLFIAFGLISLLSIVSVSGIVYVNMRATITHNAVTSVSDSIHQADESLNIMLQEVDRLNTVVVTNKDTVIDTLLSPNQEISYEWFQDQKQITEFLSSLIDYKPYISRIAVVGLNGKVFFAGDPWLDRTFLETPAMDYILQNGSKHAYVKPADGRNVLTVGRNIRYEGKTIGVVMVDLTYDSINQAYAVKPTADSLLYVINEQNEFIYPTDAALSPNEPSQETIIGIKQKMNGTGDPVKRTIDGRSYIEVRRVSAYTGWTTLALIPMDSLYRESTRIRNLMIEVSVAVFFIILIGALQISSRTTINIRRLKSMMMQVREGNLSLPHTEIRTKDEIGELYLVFIGMVEELKRLMKDIRISERQKREAEMTALQAQIRPHFLYNSLNTIKYLAKLNGVSNIEEISGSLIELMRGVLGNANEFLTVREELDYVTNYVSIEKYKYMEPIWVYTQVEDEALLECRVLKLMLQPLVENAIIHGVGQSVQGGNVRIRVYAESNDLLLEVTNDGKGITQAQMETLLGDTNGNEPPSRFSGMGIRNVHERIVRMFGEPYGVKLDSEQGRYTKVTIRFPQLRKPEDNEREAAI